jgi:DUF1680 family protein
MPNVLETSLKGSRLTIENKTSYPHEQTLRFRIQSDKPLSFTLKIRKPGWATGVVTKERYNQDGDFLVIHRMFSSSDEVIVSFATEVQVRQDAGVSVTFRLAHYCMQNRSRRGK